jgi:hypothetical protein
MFTHFESVEKQTDRTESLCASNTCSGKPCRPRRASLRKYRTTHIRLMQLAHKRSVSAITAHELGIPFCGPKVARSRLPSVGTAM